MDDISHKVIMSELGLEQVVKTTNRNLPRAYWSGSWNRWSSPHSIGWECEQPCSPPGIKGAQLYRTPSFVLHSTKATPVNVGNPHHSFQNTSPQAPHQRIRLQMSNRSWTILPHIPGPFAHQRCTWIPKKTMEWTINILRLGISRFRGVFSLLTEAQKGMAAVPQD